jgi:hypothetical protein
VLSTRDVDDEARASSPLLAGLQLDKGWLCCFTVPCTARSTTDTVRTYVVQMLTPLSLEAPTFVLFAQHFSEPNTAGQ